MQLYLYISTCIIYQTHNCTRVISLTYRLFSCGDNVMPAIDRLGSDYKISFDITIINNITFCNAHRKLHNRTHKKYIFVFVLFFFYRILPIWVRVHMATTCSSCRLRENTYKYISFESVSICCILSQQQCAYNGALLMGDDNDDSKKISFSTDHFWFLVDVARCTLHVSWPVN